MEIPFDPARWSIEKSSGWARFDKNALEQEVRRKFRDDLVRTLAGQELDEPTLLLARESLAGTLRAFLGQDDLAVEIAWR